MTSTRRFTLTSIALASAFCALAGIAEPALAHPDDSEGLRSGMVFTSSNDQSGNELLVYARGRNGTLTMYSHAVTGGQGTGAGLGSQGAVTLSGDGRFVFVVNALSNSISTFELLGHDLHLASTVSSGGLHPISVTENDGTVFVLNDAGDGNVAGFRNVRGDLKPIAGSARGLSVAGGAGPGQVGLSDDGEALVVTEKTTNRLTSFRVKPDGSLGPAIVTASTPTASPAMARSNRSVQSPARPARVRRPPTWRSRPTGATWSYATAGPSRSRRSASTVTAASAPKAPSPVCRQLQSGSRPTDRSQGQRTH